jgi:hypothetical protein
MKLLFFIIIFCISVCPLFAQSPFLQTAVPDSSTDFLFLQSLHPHPEGSENEKRVIRFIEERLAWLHIPFKKIDFSKAAGGHSFSYILETSLAGRLPDTLILAIPLNHDAGATVAGDGSFGIAAGLALIDFFRKQTPAVTVRVVFLGGEFESEGDTYLGTTQFLRSFYPVERQALLYLNLQRFPAAAVIRYGGKGMTAPLWIVRSALQALSSSGVPHSLNGIDLPVYRSALEIANTPVASYLAAGIPALEIDTSGTPSGEPLTADRARAFVDFVAGFANSFAGGFPADWDRHFIILSVPWGPPLFISETVYLIVLIVFLIVLILIALFHIPRLKKYAATLKRNFWNIPFFLIAAFLLLTGVTFLLDAVLALRNSPELWTAVPALFFLLKLSLFMAAVALLYRSVSRLPFSKNGSFYTAAALVFTVICILVVACLNISFAYYFLWPLACIILGSRTRSRNLKMVCFGISPLPVILLLLQLFLTGEPRLLNMFIFNKTLGNLLFTVTILPYLLLLIRIRFLFPLRRGTILSSKSFRLFAGAFIIACGIAVFLLFYTPFDRNNPQPVLAEQIIDYDRGTHTLALSSPAPLGNLEIVDKTGPHPVRTSARSYLIPLSEIKDYVSYESTATRFASRKNIDFSFRFAGAPYKVTATVSSTADFKLYDSNFPVEQKDGGRYSLSIGINPPPRLQLELTLPMERSYTIELEVLYRTADPGLDIHGDNITIEHRLRFKKTISFSL